ncbi:hypothetical protein M378DRAFT_186692 [Amanita muscaria Koide BX008]|uniref:Uncharacterized protein n=1 Tax=Amanita muscaria (strain Koide BX008) TaxID=946122 RepID=A0A0C2X5U0_AMAMK|nr:hypothetical protein M378DRAFT_186692 [Amanita muscaria Koide BX008]
MLTGCYTSMCREGGVCYTYGCPRNVNFITGHLPSTSEGISLKSESWSPTLDPEVLKSLPERERKRQEIIYDILTREEQYVGDLDTIEATFIQPLVTANPPVVPSDQLERFIDDVFGNILDLRECNKRLLEALYVRQREQAPIIHRIGDIFLDAAAEFILAYPDYIGHYPIAEKRMKDELETNHEFRLFLEQCARQSARSGESIRLDLKHLLNRPIEHLNKYPVFLEAVLNETEKDNPDADFLEEASTAFKNLQSVARLRTFQTAMGKGTGKWEWHDSLSPDIRATFTKQEATRQAIISELIKGEMAYVKDLENIETIYIRPLCEADPPIIPPNKLDQFIKDVFHNYRELYEHHARLVEKFHEIQSEQHPKIRSVIAAVMDTARNFRDAYMEYLPHYPMAAYRIDEEVANNTEFKAFVEACTRHPDAHHLDMKNFINMPIPRLLRYELLFKTIMEETTEEGHEDLETITHVIDVIKALGKDTEPGVVSAKQKVELCKYNANLVFKHGKDIDLDLLNENRSLIYSGKLLRQPDSGLGWNGWSELFILLFDNYLVMTKVKELDGVTKYIVTRRPIPLDLLTLASFNDSPTQRRAGLLRGFRCERYGEAPTPNTPGASPDAANDSQLMYPLTLHYNGRMGGPYILYAYSQQARLEWKSKLEEALVLRRVVQDSNKVFEVETLSADKFLMSASTGSQQQSWNQEVYTGKVACSVPFTSTDGRALVAIGCAEGVWIGSRHDPKSVRRVLHLKLVTQVAILEEFGIFLVLADKSLFAYHIEALVPTSISLHTPPASQVPQKLNQSKDVHFFRVGSLHNRTLVIYMKKKGSDSIFRVLEPVGEKISQGVRAPIDLFSRLRVRSAKSDWFRIYRDFFLPFETFDLIFLKARVAVLSTKGFEIMDLNNFDSVTIPPRENPLPQLARRCESGRPKGMFRSAEDEFLLCYDEFGVYVDKRGDPSRSAGIIEWEGTAERVALHAPYILLFDSRFIEIRHIKTGRLAQIISGNDLRCIWDGRGIGTNVAATPIDGHYSEVEQEAQVHAVMLNPEGSLGNRKAVAQTVFELIPTVPLYLPGSLSAPTSAEYMPHPLTPPPQSPELRT